MDIKEETYQFLSDLGIQYEQAEHVARKQNSIFS